MSAASGLAEIGEHNCRCSIDVPQLCATPSLVRWMVKGRDATSLHAHALSLGIQHLRDLSVAMDVSAEARAKLREGMQRSVALALGNPDEVPAIIERHRRKE